MRKSAIIVDLSRRAMKHKFISTCRQWVVGSFIVAVAVTFVPAGIYVQIFFWVFTIICMLYYFQVMKMQDIVNETARRSSAIMSSTLPSSVSVPALSLPLPLSSLAAKETSNAQPPVVSPLPPTTPAASLSPLLAATSPPPGPHGNANLRLPEASRLADNVFLKTRTAVSSSSTSTGLSDSNGYNNQSNTFSTTSASIRAPLPPLVSQIPGLSSPSNLTATSSTTNNPQTLYTPTNTLRSQQGNGYHISPMSVGRSPAEPSTVGTMRWGLTGSLRLRDSLLALKLNQIRDEWIEDLRLILGKHLLQVVKVFDQAAMELSTTLNRMAGPPTNLLQPDDLKKALLLIERSTDQRRLKLANGSAISIDEVLAFCKQINIPTEILHRYEVASSFFRLCQSMLDSKMTAAGSMEGGEEEDRYSSINNQVVGNGVEEEMQLFAMPQLGSSQIGGKKCFLARLKDMMQHSMDGRIRVQWSHGYGATAMGGNPFISSSSSTTSNSLTDQEIVIAVFLHKCDSLAAWKPAFSHLKFSQTHYATGIKDVQRISNSLLQSNSGRSSNASSNSLRSNSNSLSSDSWCICFLLNTQPLQSMDSSEDKLASPFSSSSGIYHSMNAGSNYPHFDIYRASLRGSSVKEVLCVERGRNDCFEAMLILLIVIFITYQYTDEEYSDSKGNFHRSTRYGNNTESAFSGPGSSSSMVLDYAVAKDLLREIMGNEGLDTLLSPLEPTDQHMEMLSTTTTFGQSGKESTGSAKGLFAR